MKSMWSCSTHNSRGCNAAVYTFQNVIIKKSHEHIHEPNSDIIYLTDQFKN